LHFSCFYPRRNKHTSSEMNQLSIVAILLLGLSVVFAQTGIAQIRGTDLDEGVTGTVKFTQINATHVRVEVAITGITQGIDSLHGMHVHQYGDLQNKTNGVSAGSHFVGAGTSTHGCEDTDVRHEGDMGNWVVDDTGRIQQTKELDLLTLTGSNSIVGLAVVLHNMTDDCAVIASAGKRLGWGVIGVANVAGNTAVNPTSFTRASCIFASASGTSVTGSIFLEPATGGVHIYGYVDGLVKDSSHGFHIHQYGDITNSTGSAAGGHYNPTNVSHALPPSGTRHVGDLPNLETYDSEGRAWFDFVSDLVMLEGASSAIGRAIIVHEKTDDGCTQPTGNSGARYAQCVIGAGAMDATWRPPTVAVDVPDPEQVTCATPSAATPSASTPKSSFAVQHTVEVLLAFGLLVLAF
jgi:Cu-Zn family superoxide dismutase